MCTKPLLWTKPKPLIKTGFTYKPSRSSIYADAKACTDYCTGKTLYYTLSLERDNWDFPSFESMMVFADLQDIQIDTREWDTYGIIRYYSMYDSIGSRKTFYDGSIAVLEGLDD